MLRGARFWALYILFIAAFSIVSLELLLRWTGRAPGLPSQYSQNVSDPYLPWKPRPGSVVRGTTSEFEYRYEHNSVGFRDVEHSLKKPSGTFRILGLGDSFTYGIGVRFEQTYLSRLERTLNEKLAGHPPVEVIKAGIPRYWPEPERVLLERYGLAYSPDLVLVGFLPNDILDTYFGLDGIEVTEGFLVNRTLEPIGSSGGWLYLHSHLFRALVVPYLVRRIGADSSKRPTPEADMYGNNMAYEKEWQKIEFEFGRMLSLTSKADARLAIVSIPQQGPWPTHPTYPEGRLSRWCRIHDVLFIATLPALRAASEREAVYYPVDGHCTAAGYAVIAEQIHRALIEKGALPPAQAK